MNRVQELIDQNMDKIPVALAKTLLDACKEEAEITKKLYRLTWTVVDSHGHVVVEDEDEPQNAFARVNLSHKTQTLIVSAVDYPPAANGYYYPKQTATIRAIDMPNHGMVLQDWVNHFAKQPSVPLTITQFDNMRTTWSKLYMVIVNSIVPYEPKKRTYSAIHEVV